MFVINIQFFGLLLQVDCAIAKKCQAEGCPKCGTQVDVSSYPRKPRGLDGEDPGGHRRFSFCCRKQGCRKRVTPPSVRFLGRKVYVGAVVLLAMNGEWLLAARLYICRQTLGRWRGFWGSVLKHGSLFWKQAKLALPPGLQPTCSAIAILEIFRRNRGSAEAALPKCLEFFSPLSIAVPSG